MKTFDANPAYPDDDIRFDRLVDGELSPAEYKALLTALDDEPGGWRRCALAFLEAQAISGELAAHRRSQQWKDKPAVTRQAAAAGYGASPPMRWTLLPAMAASFLVAFILGVTLPSLVPSGNRGAVAVPESAAGVGDEPTAGYASTQPRTVGNARLVVSGPGGTQSEGGELPIFDLPGDASGSLAQRWLMPGEPALPLELIQELQRRGHQVQRHQQYVPVNLEDGRQGVIPVESYQITPVSRRAY
jgi:hypothetical protein